MFKRKILLLSLSIASVLLAPSSGTHVLNVAVPEINSVSVGDSAISLSITEYIPGTNTPAGGNVAQTTVSLTSNSDTSRQLSIFADAGLSQLPEGASISVAIELGPSGSYTGSPVVQSITAISTNSQSLISNIKKLKIQDATVTYTLTAPPSVGPIPSTNISFTYTISNA